MEIVPSIAELIQNTLETGRVNTFTQPASNFGPTTPPGMESWLTTLKAHGVKVEVLGSNEALSDAGLFPGMTVAGCSVHEGDSGEAGKVLLFKLGRPD